MKLREIPNLLSGIKVRIPDWNPNGYVYFNGVRWVDENANTYSLGCLDDEYEDWELYQEPKLNKINTLYRYTHTYLDNSIIQSPWISLSWERYERICLFPRNKYTLVHTESKEIGVEVEE